VFLFVLEVCIQLLLLFNIDNPIVFYVYRALISAYIVALLLVTVVFGIRLHQVLNSKQATPSKLGSRARSSRASITRLIVVSSVLLFMGLVRNGVLGVVFLINKKKRPLRLATLRFKSRATFPFSGHTRMCNGCWKWRWR
jgi:hypothetical protein